ncbi:MAG: KH domain-containing protein [Ruminococcaceae bacterium]|jgi:spoIIIJ-associated protein|nr:KH domain-containing protein [Oscillospiraceae bacterium]
MLKEAIGSGATVEEATKAAKEQLGAPEEVEVKIEILKMPQKKILGLFGGSDAQVKASYEVADEPVKVKREKNEKRENKKNNNNNRKEKKPQPVKEVVVEISKPFVSVELTPTNEYDDAKEYLKAMILGIGMESCEIEVTANDEEINFEVDCGEDYGLVIGRRGETLDALQYLTRMVANHGKGSYKRVSVNVGDYREKREEALRTLARRHAIKAVKSGRSVTLEPMNPYERRVIHTAVQEVKGATSYSTGSDLDRRVTIAPDGSVKASRQSYQRNDRRRRNDSPAASVSEAPQRAPKSDFEGSSLYGKIEVETEKED